MIGSPFSSLTRSNETLGSVVYVYRYSSLSSDRETLGNYCNRRCNRSYQQFRHPSEKLSSRIHVRQNLLQGFHSCLHCQVHSSARLAHCPLCLRFTPETAAGFSLVPASEAVTLYANALDQSPYTSLPSSPILTARTERL